MPTFAFTVQADGIWKGWSSFTGAPFAYQCIDDSTDTTHDSGATKLNLGPLTLDPQGGRISFPIMLMTEHLVPDSLTLTVAAIRGGATHPTLRIGFAKDVRVGFSGTVFDPTASYTTATRTFTTFPMTGLPWTSDDLTGLEACVQSTTGQLGDNDISLISGTITYHQAILHGEQLYRGERS